MPSGKLPGVRSFDVHRIRPVLRHVRGVGSLRSLNFRYLFNLFSQNVNVEKSRVKRRVKRRLKRRVKRRLKRRVKRGVIYQLLI